MAHSKEHFKTNLAEYWGWGGGWGGGGCMVGQFTSRPKSSNQTNKYPVGCVFQADYNKSAI